MHTMAKPSILLAGAGDIASLLAEPLSAQGWQPFGLRRNSTLLSSLMTPLTADLLQPESLTALHTQSFAAVIVTLTPDEHSEAGYRRTYLDATRNLLDALKIPPQLLLFASSTSVYGQQHGEWVDELSPAEATAFNGRILREAEQLVLNSGLRACCIRFGGIYGSGRTRLLNDVHNGVHSPRDTQWSNRIHEQDAAEVLLHLLQQAHAGNTLEPVYIAVDDTPAPLAEVKNWLAEQLGVAHRWPQAEAQQYGGRRCSNTRLKASGFGCRYSDYRSGYRQLLAADRNTL